MRTVKSILFSCSLMIGVACSRQDDISQTEAKFLNHQKLRQSFDWGQVVDDPGQKLLHDYKIVNPTTAVLEVQEVNAKPCCGRVEWVGPRRLAPGEAGILRVEVKVTGRVGPVQHEALVSLPGPEKDPMRFMTVAEVLPRFSVAEEGGVGTVVSGDAPCRRTFTVTTHGVGSNLRLDLDQAELQSELPASWTTLAVKRSLNSTVLEQRRSFTVELSTGSYEGPRSASVGIMQQGELAYNHIVTWESRLAVKATPATLMFDGAKPDATLIVQTRDDLKFRIVSATADLEGIVVDPANAPSQPARNHRVKIHATKGSEQTRIGRLRIETDHPAQPVLHVAIMQLP